MDYKTIIAILLVFAFVGGVAAEDSIPLLPDEFRGSVTINGNPAPVGTVLTALINEEVRGTVTTTETGIYGGLELDDRRLMVIGYDGEVGATITFTVNGHTATETSTFTPGETQRLDLSVTYTPPSPGGSGGGGGGNAGSFYQEPATPSASFVGEASLSLSSTGSLLSPVTVSSPDKKASLYLPKGTGVHDIDGNLISEISMREATTLPSAPGGFKFEGHSFECGPTGTFFSPAITVSFTVPEDEWEEGKDYSIQCYQAPNGPWVTLTSTVDAATHTVSARVSHFSCFALFTESAAAVTATEAPVSATAKPVPSAEIPASGEPETGGFPWTTLLVGGIVVGVVAGGAYYMKKE